MISSPGIKNIPLSPSGKSTLRPCPSHPMRGADRDRHERAVGCGGRVACARRTQAARTVKPCGPGAPMLASRSWEASASRGQRWQKSLAHRGERAISRKSPRRESRMPPLNLYARVHFLFVPFAHETAGAACTRLSLRPLCSRAATTAKLGRIAPRGYGAVPSRCLTFEYELLPSGRNHRANIARMSGAISGTGRNPACRYAHAGYNHFNR
jgi:hypothetical protein